MNYSPIKRLFVLCFYLISFYYSKAQVITANPVMPTADQPVVITFDATKASNTSLVNYTGTVYAHTGVIIEGDNKWQYVIESWGDNTTQPALTRTGTNTYTLNISPSIRAFYGVHASKKIVRMCFVFRSATVKSDNKKTEDIFYNVYEQGLTVKIASPDANKPIYEHNSTIDVQVNANGSTALGLLIDGVQVANTATTSISYNYTCNQYGKHWFKAIASNSTSTAKDSVYIIVRPEVTTAELPSGVTPGVNVIDNHTATFVLNDPVAKKEYCYLIGDFSEWMLDEQFYMNRTPDGKYYWLTLNNLEPSREYIYQFLLDGQIRLADPYCTKTSDQYDKYISETNYPSLINYPEGKTSGVASVFKIDTERYEWKTNSFTPPKNKDLVIYELHVRDFVGDEYIQTAKDSISYLKKLGVNAIELMPISEFQGNDSWGYNPTFYFAPDKAYGTRNDYKEFIDSCHSQGIAVIMDIVLNHSYEESPLVQMYFDKVNNRPSADNPWYNPTSPNTSYSWGYDFNHESIHTQHFIDSILSYWLTEYRVDGFRFDFTKGFTNTPGDGSAYDASRIAILKRMADHIWSVKPDAFVILEHFCFNSEEKELAEYGMMLWGNLNYAYNEATMGWISNSNFSYISYKHRDWALPHLVGYMESHDEERLMYKNEHFGNSASGYNIKEINTALNRNKLAAVFFFTVPGPKMIWQFGELGYDIPIDSNGRVGRKPIKWEYYHDYNRRQLYNTYGHLIHLRNKYEVFGTNNFTISFAGATKWIKLFGSEMNAVAIGNFDVKSQNLSLDFPASGRWYEYFTQDSTTIETTAFNANLEPGEYRLYTSKRIRDYDVFPAEVKNFENENNPGQMSIWPNPTTGDFYLSFRLNEVRKATLSIISIFGQKVYSSTYTNLSWGNNIIPINYSLPKGMYVVQVQAGKKLTAAKLIVQ